jgi:hypothetical protein
MGVKGKGGDREVKEVKGKVRKVYVKEVVER